MHVFSLIFCSLLKRQDWVDILSISLTRPLLLPKDQWQLLHSPSTSFSQSFQLVQWSPERKRPQEVQLPKGHSVPFWASQHTCVCTLARIFALEIQIARTKMQVKDVLLKQSNRAEMQLLPAQADSCWFTNSVLKITSQDVQQRENSTKGEHRPPSQTGVHYLKVFSIKSTDILLKIETVSSRSLGIGSM